ncbi:hypothetical protein KI387_038499, partial [Taxus chinensis]
GGDSWIHSEPFRRNCSRRPKKGFSGTFSHGGHPYEKLMLRQNPGWELYLEELQDASE